MGYEPDNAVSDPEYYLGQPTRTPPTFEGKGAKLLGIEGTWDDATFRRLFRGHRPDHDIKLPGIRMVKNRRGAFDHTFNDDKSVTLADLVAEDDRIPAVAYRAEQKAMAVLERSARCRVRKSSEIERSKAKQPKGWKYPERRTGNIVAARFDHFDSRTNDPHGHRHWVVLNLTYDRVEREWKAVELRYTDRKAVSEAYHSEYAKGLRELGYDAEWDGKRLQIHGVDEGAMREFSQRAEGIKKTKAKYAAKGLSKQGRQKVQLFDRPEDKEAIPLDDLRKSWVSRLTGDQFDGLRRLVRKAKDKVRQARFQRGINRHLDNLRGLSIMRAEPAQERKQAHER